jgi:hypothetical protein
MYMQHNHFLQSGAAQVENGCDEEYSLVSFAAPSTTMNARRKFTSKGRSASSKHGT